MSSSLCPAKCIKCSGMPCKCNPCTCKVGTCYCMKTGKCNGSKMMMGGCCSGKNVVNKYTNG